MRVLITAGPTHEPIDPVRYIGNRSSGRMGAALVEAALEAGHAVTLIAGPVITEMPEDARRIDVQTAREMHDAVMREFPDHDLLIMSAAVADYRPRTVSDHKLGRGGLLTIECEATEDIIAAAGKLKQSHQRTVGFSLEDRGNVDRAREKLARKNLDLMVYNPTETMSSVSIDSVLIWPDGRSENLASRSKADFADILLRKAADLF